MREPAFWWRAPGPMSALLGPVAGQLSDRLVTTDLAHCDVSITGCECLVARTGSIVMSAGQPSGRTSSVYAPIHICIVHTSQLVYDIRDALQVVKDRYGANLPSLITFATGPSRTADIEKMIAEKSVLDNYKVPALESGKEKKGF